MRILGTAGKLACATALLLAIASTAPATEWFVNNRDGDDRFDGHTLLPVNEFTGPFKTISAAIRRVAIGDRVRIANNGIAYDETLEMIGPRFTGVTIEGNGAVVSGAKPIPLEAWQPLGNALWRFTPRRKAYYQLIAGDQALPEHPVPPAAAKFPGIPPGHWAGWHGSIYLQLQPGAGQRLDLMQLAFAAEEVGITLLDTSDLVVQNLELRHFRLDGIGAHDRCRDVVLDGVRLTENGRSGLAVGGSSLVWLKDSVLERNRLTQVLNSERARTEILSSQLGPAPWGPIRILGGHVRVDGEEYREPGR